MSRLRIYDSTKTREDIELARMLEFDALSGTEKMQRLFSLISLSQLMSQNGKLRRPAGLGLIIRKK